MSNVIAFPVPFATGPTVTDEISQILTALAERPPSANDALFAAKVAELQTNIDTATTDDDVFAAYLRMGILLGIGISLQADTFPAERTA